METIRVNVEWCEKNFCASLGDNVPGAVVLTAKTYQDLLREIPETLDYHVEGMKQDGDVVPQWLLDHDYVFEYHLVDVATVLRAYEPYVTLSALSQATGINQHLLSHYANGLKHPRPKQRQRIIEGMHKIGRELLTVV